MIMNNIQEKYLKDIFKKRQIDKTDINVEYRGKKKNCHYYLVLLPESQIVLTTTKLYMICDIQAAIRALVNHE